MKETGVIKFNCNWIKSEALPMSELNELNTWRNKMYALGWIGVNAEEIGFGNISIRSKNNGFIISGSATGKLKTLNNEHYTKVVEYDLEKNSLTAVGPILASSESLTHAVIYEYDKTVNAIIHIHNFDLWKKNMNEMPTTKKEIEYGTPAMANEMIRLFDETDLRNKKVLVMAGHEEGIISFGENLEEAGNLLLKLLQ
ncbi:MAG: class II aldolase/adducin family protein [Bacteroidota bacterium]